MAHFTTTTTAILNPRKLTDLRSLSFFPPTHLLTCLYLPACLPACCVLHCVAAPLQDDGVTYMVSGSTSAVDNDPQATLAHATRVSPATVSVWLHH